MRKLLSFNNDKGIQTNRTHLMSKQTETLRLIKQIISIVTVFFKLIYISLSLFERLILYILLYFFVRFDTLMMWNFTDFPAVLYFVNIKECCFIQRYIQVHWAGLQSKSKTVYFWFWSGFTESTSRGISRSCFERMLVSLPKVHKKKNISNWCFKVVE